jgi:hypothetical protein
MSTTGRVGTLLRVLATELFATTASPWIPHAALTPRPTPWLGIGLCGRSLSAGVPVDLLAQLLAAERVRRALEAPELAAVVGDTNAVSVGFGQEQVGEAARATGRVLDSLARVLEIPLLVLRGSEVCSWADAARKFGEEARHRPYEAHQLAQMEAMARGGAALKIGWALPGASRDERYFDTLYLQRSRIPMAFAYAVGGCGLHPSRPRACPYVAASPEERLLIAPGERISGKLERASVEAPREVNRYRRLLRKIARAVRVVDPEPASGSAEAVVQSVIDRTVHLRT